MPQPSARLSGSTDWYRQAEETAATVAAQITRELCPPGTHRDAPGKECRANKRSFEWNPEEGRAGFSGGLPYVRLGRCTITVGFFGCELGAPPEPNSHLFDDMNDPDRDRNSVPDISKFQRTR